MRFKVDDKLRVVAGGKATPVDLETFAKELCGRLVEAGMIEATEENYGVSLFEATGPRYVADVCKILCEYLERERITYGIWRAFCGLTVLGDGDCPKCGGTLVLYDEETREVRSWRDEFPPEYKKVRETFRCKVCGEEIIKSYD